MSVQAGLCCFDGRPLDRDLLTRMAEATEQYGPDANCQFMSDSIGMLYRPFHTTHESRLESQPFVSSRGTMVTWDGRLDNRDELWPQIVDLIRGAPTDVAIVAAAYDRWGTDCFARLIGDWALCIWDPAQHTLVLAKDYSGVRQLYYCLTHQHRVIWCTDITPLVVLLGMQFTLNEEYVAGYLVHYPRADLTPYREIQAVPPGAFVNIKHGNTSAHRYWTLDPKKETRYKSDEQYEEHFSAVFRQAVRRRLRSDTTILAELSGGLDSSSIVCAADAILSKKEDGLTPALDTLSYYDTSEPGDGDTPYFTKVEQHRGRVGHHTDLGKYESTLHFQQWHLSATPDLSATSQAHQQAVHNLLTQYGYRVMLSGIGGDEVLGGIPDPRPELADLVVRFRLPELAKQLMAWSLAKRRPWVQLLLQAIAFTLPPSVRTRVSGRTSRPPWLDEGFARRLRLASLPVEVEDHVPMLRPSWREHALTISVLTRQLAQMALPSIGCVETRYPYLDRDLIEFLTSVPSSQLLRPRQRRSLMRRALAGLVPADVLQRSTKAASARRFLIAFQAKRDRLQNLFSSSASARFGFINLLALKDALRDASSSDGSHLIVLLRTIALELWLQDMMRRGLIREPEQPDRLLLPTACTASSREREVS